MKRALKRIANAELHYFVDRERIDGPNPAMRGNCSDLLGDCTGLSGNCSDLWGDCSGLSGDCSGLWGVCSGLSGSLDNCCTAAERAKGVNIADLVMEESS